MAQHAQHTICGQQVPNALLPQRFELLLSRECAVEGAAEPVELVSKVVAKLMLADQL